MFTKIKKYSKNSNIMTKSALYDQKYCKNCNIMMKAAFVLSEVQLYCGQGCAIWSEIQ